MAGPQTISTSNRVTRAAKAAGAAILVSLAVSATSGNASADEVDRTVAAAALASAYPSKISSADEKEVHWRDGSVTPLGDVREPNLFAAIFDHASVAEHFLYRYPLVPWSSTQPPADDPGRLRSQEFFVKMYGDCRRGETQQQLRTVRWLPNSLRQSFQITTANDLDRIVEDLAAEVEALPISLKGPALRPSGGFSCRTIAGMRLLSMHAYGAAIDLDPRVGCYWRWSGLPPSARCNQNVPSELISLFEKHGFIWGGKWFHIDTMHFEYRPELIEYSRRIAATAGEVPPESH